MRSAWLLGLLLVPQDKKEPPKPPTPRVAYSVPLAVAPGAAAKLTARGLNLDQATEVRLAEPVEGGSIAIKGKGKAEIPKESDPAVYGDTRLDLELTLPAGAAKVSFVVVNPAGTSAPYELALVPKERLLPEKEPNGGFSTAQPVESGRTVQGAVAQALDVDVFRVAGRAGERWAFDVEAQRRGSPLDPHLSLYDAAGRLVAESDDGPSTRDAALRVTLPADGVYSLVLVDANNRGGASHVYLLRLARE
jgi:hypothetical protein